MEIIDTKKIDLSYLTETELLTLKARVDKYLAKLTPKRKSYIKTIRRLDSLDERLNNILYNADITLEGLSNLSRKEFSKFRGVGNLMVAWAELRLIQNGLCFTDTEDKYKEMLSTNSNYLIRKASDEFAGEIYKEFKIKF